MHRPTAQTAALRDIIRYYEKTRFDYRIAWLNEDDQAVHFGFYDRHARTHRAALLNTNRIMAERARLQPGQLILDAGCGNGGSSLWLAANYGLEAVGITPVPHQVETARREADKRGLSAACTFIEGDYCQTPLETGAIDAIWACESLCHAADKAAFYREAARVLRPGGRIVLAEYLRYARNLTAREESLLQDWLHRWAIPDIDSPAEHRRDLLAAGFEHIEVEDFTRYAFISLKNLYLISRRWLWANYLLYPLGLRSREQHNNIVGSIRQFQGLRRGLWFYGLITARKNFGNP